MKQLVLFSALLALLSCTDHLTTGSTNDSEESSDQDGSEKEQISYADTTIVSTSDELERAFSTARDDGGDHLILLQDGEYQQSGMFVVDQPKIALQGMSGDRDGVWIKGSTQMHLFLVRESNFTLENMTLGSAPNADYGFVPNHVIQVQGEMDADHFTLRNCRVIDAFEQMLKVSKNPTNETSSDSGLVENCLFEFTTGHGLQWYTGGIDAHRAHNWTIRNNTFKNICNPDPVDGNTSLTEGAIHFWANSRGTVVENNTIINCDRGVMFGLSTSGHFDGVIRNNFIVTNRDVGIYLGHAQNTKIYNNTIYLTSDYANAIEYRFDNSRNNDIRNNLCNGQVRSRDGGQAEQSSNITTASADWFVDIESGDLHLTSARESVVDQGEVLSEVTDDIDGQARRDGAPDIGAHEWTP
ncbi:MAG: right-handed parallel beta-helix repeat-containing protein [Fibrobacterota bacterium]